MSEFILGKFINYIHSGNLLAEFYLDRSSPYHVMNHLFKLVHSGRSDTIVMPSKWATYRNPESVTSDCPKDPMLFIKLTTAL